MYQWKFSMQKIDPIIIITEPNHGLPAEPLHSTDRKEAVVLGSDKMGTVGLDPAEQGLRGENSLHNRVHPLRGLHRALQAQGEPG